MSIQIRFMANPYGNRNDSPRNRIGTAKASRGSEQYHRDGIYALQKAGLDSEGPGSVVGPQISLLPIELHVAASGNSTGTAIARHSLNQPPIGS